MAGSSEGVGCMPAQLTKESLALIVIVQNVAVNGLLLMETACRGRLPASSSRRSRLTRAYFKP